MLNDDDINVRLPPACITRWGNQHSEPLSIISKLRKFQSNKRYHNTGTRSSLQVSKTRLASKNEITKPKRTPSLVENSYLQLCKEYCVKANSGILNYLQSSSTDDRCALRELDTSDNHLGSNGLQVVIELLRCSRRMKCLKLSQQNINAAQLTELLKIVRNHQGLTSIDLSSNPLSITAARMLTELARNTTVLESIDITDTHITPEWCDRIRLRLCDIQTNRIEGINSEPIYRPRFTHRHIHLTVILSNPSKMSGEVRLLKSEIFPHVNSVLHDRGVSLVPMVIQNDKSETMLNWKAAIDFSRDSFNFFLPWVLLLCDDDDSTGGILEDVISYMIEELDKVPPHPPLTDKNGNRRPPLREQTACLHVFFNTTANCVQKPKKYQSILQHRLCLSCSYSESSMPSIFCATVVSQLLVCFDKIYSKRSHVPVCESNSFVDIASEALIAEEIGYNNWEKDYSDRVEKVISSAELYYPPKSMSCKELYSVREKWETDLLTRQWFIADVLLSGYQSRPGAEMELLRYCEHYDPEIDCTYPLVLYGQTGVGKATLISWLCQSLKRSTNSNTYAIIPLFIGEGQVRSVCDLLRHLITAVRGVFELPPPTQLLDTRSLVSEWNKLLTSNVISSKRIILLLSGIERAALDEGDLFLPLSLSVNVRMVVSVASHSIILKRLREKTPQPYEVLLTGLERQESLSVLHHHLTVKVPGLCSEEKNTIIDQGVIKQPSNAGDAVCFKDHGTCPLYLILLSEVLRINKLKLTSEESSLELIRELPETISDSFMYIIKYWESLYGDDFIKKTLALISLSLNGFIPEVLFGILQQNLVSFSQKTAPARIDMFWVDLLPFIREQCNGIYTFIHSELGEVVTKYCRSERNQSEKYHNAAAHLYFQYLSSSPSPYLKNIALAELPTQLLKAGRVTDALLVVTDPNFIEQKFQADLYWNLLSDTDEIEREMLQCSEAGIDGFTSHQFKPSPEIQLLRSVRSLCINHENSLMLHPSILQIGLNMPPSSRCFKAVDRLLKSEGVPHPLLLNINKRNRGSLAQSVIQVSNQAVVHVAFTQGDHKLGTLLVATTASTVSVCTMSSVIKRLSIVDEVAAPPEGFLSSVFTPDGLMIVSSAATQVVVWLWEAEAPVLHNTFDMSPSITRCLCHDGVAICAVQLATGKGCIIETRKGRVISTLKAHVDNEPIRNIFYAAMSHSVVSVGLGTICVYSGTDQTAYRGHQGIVSCCDISPDGKVVASCDQSDIHVWQAGTGSVLQILRRHHVVVKDLSFHPNGNLLTSGDVNGLVWVWSTLAHDAICGPLESGIGCCHWVGFTPGGSKLLMRCQSGVHVYNTITFTSIGIMGSDSSDINFVNSAPDMTTVATSSDDGSVHVFCIDDQSYPPPSVWLDQSQTLCPTSNIIERCDAHTCTVLDLAISCDEKKLSTIFSDGTLMIWDMQEGNCIHNITGQGIISGVFVPGSDIMILGRLSMISLFDYQSAEMKTHIPAFRGLMAEEDGEGLTLLRMSPNCKIVSCRLNSSIDEQLSYRCYNFSIPDRKLLSSLSLHTDVITGIEYLDSNRIVTASRDQYLRLSTLSNPSEITAANLAGSPIQCIDLLEDVVVVGYENGVVQLVLITDDELPQMQIIFCCSSDSTISTVRMINKDLILATDFNYNCHLWSCHHRQELTRTSLLDIPVAVTSIVKTNKSISRNPRVVVGGKAGFVYLFDIISSESMDYLNSLPSQ